VPKNNRYVITGGPASGKTTLIDKLAKLGYLTVPEAARTVIDEAAGLGISPTKLRADEKRFQEDVVRLKHKIELDIKSDQNVFFDRGMHDTIAYMRLYGFKIEDWVEQIVQTFSYKKVFLLEPLPNYEKDYARTEDEATIKKIHELIKDTYTEYGMKPISIKSLPVKERLKLILGEISD